MSTALVLASSNGERKTLSAEYRAAVKRTMRRNEYRNGEWIEVPIAAEEVDFLLFKAAAYDLDPLKGQIYATWRNGRIQVEATFDGLRSLAERTGAYRGQTKPEWCDKQGSWSEVWLEEEPPAAARVGIRREGFPEPVCVPVHFDEFKQTVRSGELAAMWKEKPAHMLAKTSASLGLRAAFPEVAGGLYTDVEMAGSKEAEESPPPAAPKPQRPSPQRHPSANGAAPAERAAAPAEPKPARRPSAPPALVPAQSLLTEALEPGGYARLAPQIARLAFDCHPDRLTDAQAEQLAAALRVAAEAGITAVELERTCKRGLGHADVALRRRALLEWIEERRRRAAARAAEQRSSAAAKEAGQPSSANAGGGPTALVEGDPGPEGSR